MNKPDLIRLLRSLFLWGFVVCLATLLPAQSTGSAPSAGGGVYVAAYRTPAHVRTSSPDVFHAAVDAVVELLKANNVNLVSDPDRPMIQTTDVISVSSLVNIARDTGAAYLLLIIVDRPLAKWIKISLQEYDLSGKPLWQEEASEGGGMSGKKGLTKTIEKLKPKLQLRFSLPPAHTAQVVRHVASPKSEY